MKKFRKLIPALCMLLVSALFVGTSTYAWFSMNKEVSASNMEVKAVSENPYLLINPTSSEITATGWVKDATLAKKTLPDNTLLNLTHNESVSTTDGAVTWTYAVSDNPAEAQGEKDRTALVNANVSTDGVLMAKEKADDTEKAYALVNDMYFKTANDTVATKLRLNDLTATTPGVKLNATIGENALEESVRLLFVNPANGATALYDPKVNTITYSDTTNYLAAEVNNKDAVHIVVYMFFDGTDTQAYTNNAVNLKAVQASFNFKVD